MNIGGRMVQEQRIPLLGGGGPKYYVPLQLGLRRPVEGCRGPVYVWVHGGIGVGVAFITLGFQESLVINTRLNH